VPTDLAQLINEAADDVRPFVEIRHQHLNIQIDGGLDRVPVDALKIRNILNHLLLNAVKFTPDDGTITLAGRRKMGRCI